MCRQLSSCRCTHGSSFTCTSNMDEGLTFTPHCFSRKAENLTLFSWGRTEVRTVGCPQGWSLGAHQGRGRPPQGGRGGTGVHVGRSGDA